MANIKEATSAYASALNQLKQPLSGGADESSGAAFGDLLKQSLQTAVDAQHKSEKVSGAALAGKADMTEVLQAVTCRDTRDAAFSWMKPRSLTSRAKPSC
ncbi:MAG: flagellar hook-basal body complex protein FliE [Proteobacteria bacterium]|nr:flagellar hook-basal body complex protein FliE [Pseudomonadota bacterium]